ncbi:hypothetical protein SAMN05216466_12192 [Paraburkholderia phenazinium]|uniref:Uncharacterized protein n=1 Tax=Paraburkholderia phenazinium TaxID=60549 RepID=A0A1G8JZM3_9BURK|nr:hypothetical protein SAMN05216466_12192 [Paraburkholderia phenazinium]
MHEHNTCVRRAVAITDRGRITGAGCNALLGGHPAALLAGYSVFADKNEGPDSFSYLELKSCYGRSMHRRRAWKRELA